MIKKMRFKFIAITMVALLILLASILVSMNVYMGNNWDRHIINHLNSLVLFDGIPPEIDQHLKIPPPKSPNLIQGFAVKINPLGNIIEVTKENSFISDKDIIDYTERALENGNDTGEIGVMRYMIRDKSYGKIIVFADKSIQDVMMMELRNLSYTIGGLSFVFLLVIVSVLSCLVTRPVEITFEKQKQFITDSSHELKTPLSILSANIDVLEMEIGQNKWLSQMKLQTKRMNKLIHELLLLAKTEALGVNATFTKFNLSHVILNTVLPFEVVAFEHGRNIKYDIAENILYKGNEQSIKKMMEALIDNAVKYSYKGSAISVKLYAKGNKKVIEVCNKGQGVTEKQKGRLFDKFYRTDDSRAREKGGYGIGLSLVKSIVDMHRGKIKAESKESEYITFRIILTG